MKDRLATVFWWFGVIIGGGIAATGLFALFGTVPAFFFIYAAIGFSIFILGCTINYVLSGSFWRVPK